MQNMMNLVSKKLSGRLRVLKAQMAHIIISSRLKQTLKEKPNAGSEHTFSTSFSPMLGMIVMATGRSTTMVMHCVRTWQDTSQHENLVVKLQHERRDNTADVDDDTLVHKDNDLSASRIFLILLQICPR